MFRVIGFVIGFLFGIVNFVFLTKMIRAILHGEAHKTLLFLFLKGAVLTCSLLLTAFFMPLQLPWNGIGLALPLIAGAFLYRPITNIAKKRRAKNDEQ